MSAAKLGLLFLEGLLAFVSPCVLPMLPVYLVYLAGDKTAEEGQRGRLVLNTLGFILGFTMVFVFMGASATSLGLLLRRHQNVLQRAGGVVLVLFGLYYMGVLKLPFLDVEKRFAFKPGALGFSRSVLFGLVFSFGWSPCIGVNLSAAMMLAASGETLASGMFALFVFSMGLGLPFMAAALFYSRLARALSFIKRHFTTIKIISGIVLIIVGLAMLFDLYSYYQHLFTW